MNWLTAVLIAAYIGVCEVRVPSPYQACESRWNWALGVLVPSPLPAVGRLLTQRKRRETAAVDSPDQG